ncbi:unnamed protein product, partial [Meganyctiphanes norvegica]
RKEKLAVMKLLLLLGLGCFLVYGSAQRVPIGGPGFGDPRPPNVVGPGGTFGGGGGSGGFNTLPGILSYFRGKRDLEGILPEPHSKAKRSPQPGGYSRFSRPQFGGYGGRPSNIVGPGGTFNGGGSRPINVVGPGGTFRGKRDLEGILPEPHSIAKRSPQPGGYSRFSRPQFGGYGGRPSNIVGPGGTFNGGGIRPINVVGPGGTFNGGGGRPINVVGPGGTFRGKKDLEGVLPEPHSRAKRSPQPGGYSRFSRPQFGGYGGRPSNIVGPGGTFNGGGGRPINVVGPGGTFNGGGGRPINVVGPGGTFNGGGGRPINVVGPGGTFNGGGGPPSNVVGPGGTQFG